MGCVRWDLLAVRRGGEGQGINEDCYRSDCISSRGGDAWREGEVKQGAAKRSVVGVLVLLEKTMLDYDRYLRAAVAVNMDEMARAGAFSISCCRLVAMVEVAFLVSGLDGWVANAAGDPLMLIPGIRIEYVRNRKSME